MKRHEEGGAKLLALLMTTVPLVAVATLLGLTELDLAVKDRYYEVVAQLIPVLFVALVVEVSRQYGPMVGPYERAVEGLSPHLLEVMDAARQEGYERTFAPAPGAGEPTGAEKLQRASEAAESARTEVNAARLPGQASPASIVGFTASAVLAESAALYAVAADKSTSFLFSVTTLGLGLQVGILAYVVAQALTPRPYRGRR